ncbi:MAG: YceI family protein [Amylibacter sp.]|jgi:OmpA-OmpF porin, OOP family
MWFLFFETLKFPETVVSAKIDPAVLSDLKTVPLSYTLDLHGLKKEFTADVVATLLTDDLVLISTHAPISIVVEDFDLTGGLAKLQDAANVEILPSATMYFDWMFSRNFVGASTEAKVSAETEKPASAVLETAEFDAKVCKGRFEILPRTGNIYFKSGSALLEAKSAPF